MKGLHNRNEGWNNPWLVIGDYNEIQFQNEREGSGSYDDDRPAEFNGMIEQVKLNELPSTGGNFTWSNKSASTRLIRSWLDRKPS